MNFNRSEFSPSPLAGESLSFSPSPLWGEGGGEGDGEISGNRSYSQRSYRQPFSIFPSGSHPS